MILVFALGKKKQISSFENKTPNVEQSNQQRHFVFIYESTVVGCHSFFTYLA